MSEMAEWDEEAENKFSELFDELDIDGSGSLTFDEIKNGGLEKGATALGNNPSDDEITQFIETLDTDDDKAVSKEEFKTFLQEFLAAIKEHMSQQQDQQQPAEGNEFVWDDETERNFEEIFNSLDTDGSNVLTLNEIQTGSLKEAAQLLHRNPTDEEVQQFLETLHNDGDGEISKDEFRTYVQKFMAKLDDDPDAMLAQAVEDMMAAIDTDENGVCSKEEFKTFLQSKGSSPLSDDDVDNLFSAVDTDGDTSTLNKEDLLRVLSIGISQN